MHSNKMIKEIKGKKLTCSFGVLPGHVLSKPLALVQMGRPVFFTWCAWERECEFSFPPVHANGRSGHAGRFVAEVGELRLGVLLYIASGTKMTQGVGVHACKRKQN
jgi:hypothetical protein